MQSVCNFSGKFLIFLFLYCSLAQDAYSQQEPIDITLKIQNAKKGPVPFATVVVNSRTDSSINFTRVADSSGKVQLKLLKGQYQVHISATDYKDLEKGINISGSQSSFVFILESLGKTLGAVTVTSQKPLMKQEDDKTIIDPENLAASSTSGYEILEKTPGLFVDQDGNIYINSLTPAIVYINGREMKMSSSDMATMLKSLPPNAISRIEILRTPSAKYDASGTGGIVNVVLRKGIKLGLTGSVNGGWQQGTYGNEFVGLNLNQHDDKKTIYVNANYSDRDNYERIRTDRHFKPDSILSQDAYTRYPAKVYFVGYGLDYEFNKKWDVSFDGRFTKNNYDNRTTNKNTIQSIATSEFGGNNLNTSRNDGYSIYSNNGLSSTYKIDTLGSEWTNDLSFTYSRNQYDQSFNTEYFLPVVSPTAGDGNSDNKRYYFTGQSDLKWKLKKKLTVETGLKTSVLNYKSVTGFFREENGVREKDAVRTNTFRYKENINALYLQGSKTLGEIVIKAGLRMENTNMNGQQLVPSDTSFDIHRTDLFPYIYLSRKFMKVAGYELRAYLVYRRTIARPVYEQLNPFPRYIDQYLSEIGNPSLRPQFTTNYEANVSFEERPVFAVGINKTKDIFTNVIYQADSSESQAYRTYDNLGSNKEWYLRALGALPPGKKYFFVVGAQYNHNFYQGLYENSPLSFKKGSWNFFTYHTLKLGKLSQVSLNGFLRLNGQQQFYELSSFGSLNTSINRQFFKQKMTVTLSMNDIFWTNRNEFTIHQGSVDAKGKRETDTRRFGINIRYNFGIRKKEENNAPAEEPAERSN